MVQLDQLRAKEAYLDQLCNWAKANIKYTMQANETRALAYVTRDDLLKSFFKHSVLTVKGHSKVQRLPVMEDNTIVLGRGLRIASEKNRQIEVLMATDEGKTLVETSERDDWKSGGTFGTGGGGGGKRKSKLVPTIPNANFENPQAVPDHFEVDLDRSDKKAVQQRFQEYKKTANALLNLKTKNTIQDRRLRLRNYYQGKCEGRE